MSERMDRGEGEGPAPVRVLLIEDDPYDQLLTRDALADVAPGRYAVTCAANYEEGLAQLRAGAHDVALLDYRLGAQDGLELLRAVASAHRAPVIVLTGQGEREIDEAALRAGAADYLVKGQITPELLDRSIRYTLQRRAAEEQAVELAREQAARAEAEAANRARDEFVNALSHDLRNPLAAIKGQAQVLQRRLARGEAVDAERLAAGLRSIEATVASASTLVGNLLDVARVQAGVPLELQRRPTDLVALARRAITAHGQATELHSLRLEAAVESLEGRWDAERLERVLANLLSNAVKFSPAGGEVTVRVTTEADVAVLAVCDPGVGIPADDLPRLFERYQRASNISGQIAGTGLGLVGARHIVEQHGGTIAVESREGAGSVFTIRLPRGDDGTGEPSPPLVSAHSAPTR